MDYILFDNRPLSFSIRTWNSSSVLVVLTRGPLAGMWQNSTVFKLFSGSGPETTNGINHFILVCSRSMADPWGSLDTCESLFALPWVIWTLIGRNEHACFSVTLCCFGCECPYTLSRLPFLFLIHRCILSCRAVAVFLSDMFFYFTTSFC